MSLPKPRHSSDSAAICLGQSKYGTPKNNALTRLKSLSDKGMVVDLIDIYGPYNTGLYNMGHIIWNHIIRAIPYDVYRI